MSDDDRDTPPSPPPPPFDDETTGTYSLPREIRPWARSTSRRIKKLEAHYDHGGMVYEIHSDWSAVKKFAGVFKWLAPMIASLVVALIVGIIWLVQHAATQPVPPNARDIAREIAKQHDK